MTYAECEAADAVERSRRLYRVAAGIWNDLGRDQKAKRLEARADGLEA